MDLENEVTNEEVIDQVIEETPSEAVEAPPEENEVQTDNDTVVGEEAPVEPEIPQYEPNFQYKSNQEMKEFDERLKSVIKSKEDEEFFRRMSEKADGFETAVEKREAKIKEITNDYQQLNSSVEPIVQMLKRQDYDNVMKVLGIPEDKLIELAYKKVQYQQLTPEQKSQYDRQQETSYSQYELERQNQEYKQQLQQIKVDDRHRSLQTALATPEVSSIVADFDSRSGQQGAFAREVIKRGAQYYNQQNIDKSPEELVSEIVNLYGLKKSAPPLEAPQAKPIQNLQQPKAKPPVIPNTGNMGSGTPIKKSPQSLSDIRKAMASGE